LINLVFILFLLGAPIEELVFIGNESVPHRNLEKELISKKGEEYNSINIDFDIERLIRYYRTQGFFTPVITSDIDSVTDGVKLMFHIAEGDRPRIKEIRVYGAHKDKLTDFFQITTDDFFIGTKIKYTEDSISNHYKDRGFAYIEVGSEMIPDSGLLVFTVDRGLVHYIRNIDVEGLRICRPDVVLREIELGPGDQYNKTKLIRSQRRIYSLGFFSTVNIDMTRHEPDSVDILFQLRELKSRIMNFGIGVSIPISFLISYALEELNLFNRGHRFQIRPQFKVNIDREWEAKLEGRYTIPYVSPWRFSISVLPFLWHEEQEAFTRQTRGNEFRLSKLFTENIQFNIGNQYKYVDIRLKPGETISDTIRGVTNSMNIQLMFDYRTEFFNPHKGYYVLPFIEYAGGVFGGANHFVRLEAEGRLFIPVFQHTIAQRLRIGTIRPTDGCALYEKYFLGGQYSVRGYADKSIGPDSIATEKYGEIMGNYNLELRISLPWAFGLVGFFDVGYVDNEINFMRSDYFKASTGFGLRYYSPIGPVRMDIGFGLTDPSRELYLGIYHIF